MFSCVGNHAKSLALVDVYKWYLYAPSGQGGGIPFGKADEIWSYLFSTSTQPFQDDGARAFESSPNSKEINGNH